MSAFLCFLMIWHTGLCATHIWCEQVTSEALQFCIALSWKQSWIHSRAFSSRKVMFWVHGEAGANRQILSQPHGAMWVSSGNILGVLLLCLFLRLIIEWLKTLVHLRKNGVKGRYWDRKRLPGSGKLRSYSILNYQYWYS